MKKFVMLGVSALCLMATLAVQPTVARADDNHDVPAGHTAVWFEIPVTDMSRAVAFYNALLAAEMTVNNEMGVPMAFLPNGDGALIQMAEMVPGATGPVLYLNGGDDLQPMLDRVVPAGGTVVVPKTLIREDIGYFAIFLDTEGNRLGLFSRN